MRILVLGSGAREHALAWKFSRSNRLSGLFIAPGNPGTANLGENLPELDPCSPEEVVAACRSKKINLVFVGPEAPLAAGIVDSLQAEGIAVIGPNKAAARLESSKAFSKEFMVRNNVPTAVARQVRTQDELEQELSRREAPLVVKMDGLAAGKGVLEAESIAEARAFAIDALVGGPIVVEDFLDGYEVSIFVLIDANGYKMLPSCADYKKAGERSTGPNTGGMGAVCPVPWLSKALEQEIESTIVEPTLRGLNSDGLRYTGVLYIGLMITSDGPKVLEYNVRFGDPETQVLLPLLRADLIDICEAMVEGKVSRARLETDDLVSVGIVVASAGYPIDHRIGFPIAIDCEKAHPPTSESIDRIVFQGGTALDREGRLITNGGRCVTCVARERDLVRARVSAYQIAEKVVFEGAWFRGDIASRVFGE